MIPRSCTLALLLLAGCATTRPMQQSLRPIPPTGATFSLFQPWTTAPDPQFRPTTVRLAWTPEMLTVDAELTDDMVTTRSTADNQPMWELGDVFEIFLALEGNTDYLELHVTPHNHRVQAHLPGPGGRATPETAPLPFEKMTVTPVGFSSRVTRTPSGWRVQAQLPAKLLGLESFASDQRLRVSFGRYDAHATGEPSLSTSSPHPIVSFHRPDEWQRIILEN